jgi:hypothetical protein
MKGPSKSHRGGKARYGSCDQLVDISKCWAQFIATLIMAHLLVVVGDCSGRVGGVVVALTLYKASLPNTKDRDGYNPMPITTLYGSKIEFWLCVYAGGNGYMSRDALGREWLGVWLKLVNGGRASLNTPRGRAGCRSQPHEEEYRDRGADPSQHQSRLPLSDRAAVPAVRVVVGGGWWW